MGAARKRDPIPRGHENLFLHRRLKRRLPSLRGWQDKARVVRTLQDAAESKPAADEGSC